ncbi:MAG: acyl-CoA dehydrogenase family protein, partial [Acidimicrobiales bacterium]
MRFDEDDTHQDLRDGVRRVCAGFPDAYWRDLDSRHEFPWAFYEAMAEGGWIGVALPERYGGGGLGITEASIVLEEVAASGAAMNGCSALHTSI